VRAIQAELENELYKIGRPDEVTVSPADDDAEHLRVHDQLMRKPEKMAPEVLQALVLHMKEHMTAMMAKQVMQQMQAAQQAGGAGMGGGLMLEGPMGEASSGAMNPGRLPMTATQGDLGRTMDRMPDMQGMGGGGPVG
jgi:hypothetical protein